MDLSAANKFFAQGQSACYDTATNVFPSIKTGLQFSASDLAYSLFPTFDGKKPFGPEFLSYWAMGVSSNSKAPDATDTVLDYWQSSSADLLLAQIGGQQPKRISTSKDKFFDAPERSYLKLIAQGVVDWGPPSIAPPVPTAELLIEALQQVVTQNKSVKDAMGGALAQYNKLLSELPPDKLPKN